MSVKETIDNLLSRTTAYAARIEGEFTPTVLANAIESYQRNGRKVSTLLLCAEHTDALATNGEFADFLDPSQLREMREQGHIGALLGLAVYSETAVPKNERILRGVSYLFP